MSGTDEGQNIVLDENPLAVLIWLSLKYETIIIVKGNESIS